VKKTKNLVDDDDDDACTAGCGFQRSKFCVSTVRGSSSKENPVQPTEDQPTAIVMTTHTKTITTGQGSPPSFRLALILSPMLLLLLLLLHRCSLSVAEYCI
jgi:hypothetical protein